MAVGSKFPSPCAKTLPTQEGSEWCGLEQCLQTSQGCTACLLLVLDKEVSPQEGLRSPGMESTSLPMLPGEESSHMHRPGPASFSPHHCPCCTITQFIQMGNFSFGKNTKLVQDQVASKSARPT